MPNKTNSFYLKPLLCLLILGLFFFLQGCNSWFRWEKEEIEKIPSALTIVCQEHSLLYLPLYAAMKQGYCEQENLTIRLVTANKEEAVAGLLSGDYDLMLSGPEIGFYHYQQENQEKFVFVGQLATKSGCYLLSRDKEKPFTWQESKGKVIIGLASGEAAQIALESVLRKQQLRPFLDVHMVNNLPTTLRSGVFSSGTGHFMLCDEPTATIMEKEEQGLVVASLDEFLGINLPTVLISPKTIPPEKEEAIQRLEKALGQGLIWLQEKAPDEILPVAKDFFPEQEESTLLRGIGRYKNLGCWPETTKLTEKELQHFQQLLLDAQELNSPLPLYELIKNP